MKWQAGMTIDPLVCYRRACVTGTRVMVSVVMGTLAMGVTHDEILRWLCEPENKDIDGCIGDAAERTRERVVPLQFGAD
jgi:uncharacterized protein (DUF433 family)